MMSVSRMLALLPLTLLLLPVAFGASLQTGTGSFTTTVSNVHSRSAGGNTIASMDVSFALTGAFSGTCVGKESAVMHRDGSATFHGTCAFTGMGAGKQGTITFVFGGHSTSKSFKGHFTSISSGGGLSGLHVHGTFTPTGPTTGDYSVEFHFSNA